YLQIDFEAGEADKVDTLQYAVVFCDFFRRKEGFGIYFFKKFEASETGRFEYGERDSFVVFRTGDGSENFFAGFIKNFFAFFAFYGIVEDSMHIKSSQVLNGIGTVANGLATAKLVEYGLLDNSLDGQADVEGQVGQRAAYLYQKVA